jgi:ABC-type dipeptide/oligopeptide/nickel transport system ATPase subunit
MEEYEQESTESEVSEVKIDIKELARVNELPFKLPKALRYLLDGFKWAIDKKNQSAVTIVDGRSGMGKTTLSLQMASYMSPNFSIDDVYFTPEKFLEGLANTKKGDKKVLVFDEAMLLSSRAALSQINRMIVIAMSMIRSKNLFIIFNVNSIFDLDKKFIKSCVLNKGDVVLLSAGGHGFTMLEKSEIIEVKTGPHLGELDKTRFNEN